MSITDNAVFELDKDGKTRRALILRTDDRGMRGASGTMHALRAEAGKAIKIYHEKERSKFEEKIRTMIKVRYNRPHAELFDLAWPEAIVVDTYGSFLGFKMPFLEAAGWTLSL